MHHALPAVQTEEVDGLGGPDGIAAAGALILPAGAPLGCGRGGIAAVGACTGHGNAVELVAGDEDVRESVLQHEVQQGLRGAGDGPAVLLAVLHREPVALRSLLEAAVVVGPAPAGVFDAVEVAVIVAHLVEQGGADVLNGAGQRPGSDVYLVGGSGGGYPRVVPQGEVAVSLGRALNGDGGS